MLRQITLSIAGVLVSSAALAADNGIYFGAGISQSSVETDIGSGSTAIALDGEDTKYKVIGGIRPLDWLAFEVNYVDFGTIETPSGAPQAEYTLKGFDVFAVGLWEIGLVDFYAKAGAIGWNSELDTLGNALADADDDGYDLAYGGGIQVHFGSLSARAEYEQFDIEDTDVGLISLAVTWTFL
jgi:hypothetical protein